MFEIEIRNKVTPVSLDRITWHQAAHGGREGVSVEVSALPSCISGIENLASAWIRRCESYQTSVAYWDAPQGIQSGLVTGLGHIALARTHADWPYVKLDFWAWGQLPGNGYFIEGPHKPPGTHHTPLTQESTIFSSVSSATFVTARGR